MRLPVRVKGKAYPYPDGRGGVVALLVVCGRISFVVGVEIGLPVWWLPQYRREVLGSGKVLRRVGWLVFALALVAGRTAPGAMEGGRE